MEKKFKRVHTPTDFIISGILIAASFGLFFVSKGIGITLAIISLLLLVFLKSGFQRENDPLVLSHKKIEIGKRYQQAVLDFLNGKSEELQVKCGNEGGTLLLETWYNPKEGVAFAQLNVYEELSFQPITEIIELKDNQAKTLIEKL